MPFCGMAAFDFSVQNREQEPENRRSGRVSDVKLFTRLLCAHMLFLRLGRKILGIPRQIIDELGGCPAGDSAVADFPAVRLS